MFPDLKSGKHLLFDNTSVADTYRLRRSVHQPKRDPREPVLKPERPWEGTRTTPLQVLFDAERKTYRMWYCVYDAKAESTRAAARSGLLGRVGEPQPLYVCYAESEDGIHWTRPDLGIHGATNICFKGHSGAHGTIIRDPRSRGYVMANLDWFSPESGGICLAFAEDGIHWQYRGDNPVIFGHSDTTNCIVFNEGRQVFMLYMRGWHAAAVNWPVLGKGNPRRRVAYSESRDLKAWTEPQIILSPDELDPNDFYGIHVFKYGDSYLGQLWLYDEDGEETIDVELIYSRDGIHWQRFPERTQFIPRGNPGDPDGYMVFPAQSPLIVGDDILVYWSGMGAPHNCCRDALAVGFRGRLRMDGFVSLSADQHSGALITRPFVLQSDSIAINAATHAGEIVAEICEPYYHEPEGKPIEGFKARDFDVFHGDSIHHKLSWKGESDLSAFRGERLMLRMLLTHADLYSFTI